MSFKKNDNDHQALLRPIRLHQNFIFTPRAARTTKMFRQEPFILPENSAAELNIGPDHYKQ